jgi:hypothetical protein
MLCPQFGRQPQASSMLSSPKPSPTLKQAKTTTRVVSQLSWLHFSTCPNAKEHAQILMSIILISADSLVRSSLVEPDHGACFKNFCGAEKPALVLWSSSDQCTYFTHPSCTCIGVCVYCLAAHAVPNTPLCSFSNRSTVGSTSLCLCLLVAATPFTTGLPTPQRL